MDSRLSLTAISLRTARADDRSPPDGSCFSTQLSSWLRTFARRTNQLTGLLYAVSLEVGAEVAHRIFKHFQIQVSGDALLRVLRQKPTTSSHDLHVIGGDDRAFKHGCNYGTISINLETHQVVDLPPDRTADTLANWLQAHPTIEIVARDRSTNYASRVYRSASSNACLASSVSSSCLFAMHHIVHRATSFSIFRQRVITTAQHNVV